MKNLSLSIRNICLSALIAACSSAVFAAEPYIGYIYPAGGQKGTTLEVTVGGQFIRGAREVYVSKSGVRATVSSHARAGGVLNAKQVDELKRRLAELQKNRNAKVSSKAPAAAKVELPDLPEFRDLDKLTSAQLNKVRDKYINNAKKTKPPIAESVVIEVSVDENAEPGDYELRLLTASGLTNPIIFQISNLPELREPDPNDIYAKEDKSPVSPDTVFNGRIMPGETDFYQIPLKQGQSVSIKTQARHLIPYLADAVPGWFQAFLSLSDDSGKEVASADHTGYDPDPSIRYTAEKDGIYTLRIRDTLYRGRTDFIYRISVMKNASLDTPKAHISDSTHEIEPNDTGKLSQAIKSPSLVSGKINKQGDVDVYKIIGRAGEEVVAKVHARRLGSQMDSLLRLINESGKVIASNDDYNDGSGLLTHHADSYLLAKLPASGVYYVQVSDTQRHAGENHFYQLRVGPAKPDFALRIAPSSINIPSGGSVPVTVFAFRKDGFKGNIQLSLKDAPAGYKLSGALIPEGADCVRITISAPRVKGKAKPIELRLVGMATAAGETIVRDVVPAQNMMQAFAYMHLVPAQQLLVSAIPDKKSTNIGAQTERLTIPLGGQANYACQISPLPKTPVHLALSDPPPGISIENVQAVPTGITCTVKSDAKLKPLTGNLIFEVVTEAPMERKGVAVSQGKRVSLGFLPAVPISVVSK